MSDPFLGEVRMFGFGYAPYQWAACNGAIVNIQQFAALFSLIGTAFGGDGTRNFQLPNLAARMLCSTGTGPGLTQRLMGDDFGTAAVMLVPENLSPHNHGVGVYQVSERTAGPTDNSALSISTTNSMYVNDPKGATVPLSPTSIAGSNSPHENRQPMLAMNFSIALSGQFPQFD